MSQTKNAKKIKVHIVGRDGEAVGMTSLAHARRYVRRGVAKWLEGLSIRFLDAADIAAWAYADLDIRPFPVDLHYQDGRGVMKFWRDQRSSGGHSRAA